MSFLEKKTAKWGTAIHKILSELPFMNNFSKKQYSLENNFNIIFFFFLKASED
jgi:hypothetical protein